MRSTLVLPLLLALLAAGISPAQEFGPGDAGRDIGTLVGKPWSVPDSQEVLFLTTQARKHAAKGEYETAMLRLQHLLDFYTGNVILVDPGAERFAGVRRWCHSFVRSLPPEGIETYRRMSGPEARRLLHRAIEQRNRGLLLEVLRRFYLSGEGPAALRAVAMLDLEDGRPGDAAHHLALLLRDFPDRTTVTDLARLAFARARGGDGDGYRKLLEDHPSLRSPATRIVLGGRSIPVTDFLARIGKGLPARSPGESGANRWPLYGRTPSREAPAPPLSRIGPFQWSVPTHYREREEDLYTRRIGRWEAVDLLSTTFPIFPVIDGGTVIFQNGSSVVATNLYTGKTVWSFKGPFLSTQGKTNPATVHSLAVSGGIVYANLEVEVPTLPRAIRTYAGRTVIFYIPQRRLFALEEETGRVVWSHADPRIRGTPSEDVLLDANVNSPPLVVGDSVYVTASHLEQRYSLEVLSVSARTGRVRWRTRLCTGQQELNLFGRPVKELAPSAISERDGTLYVCSNLGVAAALDRRTGEIVWMKGYPQIPIPPSTRWHTTEERRNTWTNAPPVVTADTVYFTPTDSRELIALRRSDGALRFRIHGGDPTRDDDYATTLLGAGDRYIYLAGSRVFAVDRRTGKLVWGPKQGSFRARAPDEEREEARGRGLLARDAVYVTTQRGLYAFDPETGKQLSFDPLPLGEGKDRPEVLYGGGNLVAAGGALLVARRRSIVAYFLFDRVYRELEKRVRADPENPDLALELAGILALDRRPEDAVREYERARALARNLPEPRAAEIDRKARRGLFGVRMEQGRAAVKGKGGERALSSFRSAFATAVTERDRVEALLAMIDVHRSGGDVDSLRSVYERMERDLGRVIYPFPSLGRMPAGLYALVRLSDLALGSGHPEEAIGTLTRILASYPRRELPSGKESQIYARERIARIIEDSGRKVYARFEAKAGKLLDAALASGSPEGLAAVVERFPNSRAAGRAAVALGRLWIGKGDYRAATTDLRRFLADFPESPFRAEILHLLATALEKRGFLVSARAVLLRLARRYADAPILVNGEHVPAGIWARTRLAEKRFLSLSRENARITLPLTRLWSRDEGESSYVMPLEPDGPVPPGAGDILLLGTNGVLRAVEARGGKTLWQRGMNGMITRAAFAEGALVLVNQAGFTGVQPATGKVLWERENDSLVRAVRSSAGLVFVLGADRRDQTDLALRAVSPRTGDIVWSRPFPDHQTFGILLVTEESVAVASIDPAGVVVLDTATGRIRFRVEMEPRSLYREPFLIDGDKLFVLEGGRKYEFRDVTSGTRIGSGTLPGQGGYRSGVPAAGGVVFEDSGDLLSFLGATNGKIRWTVPPDPLAPLLYESEIADDTSAYVVRKRKRDQTYVAEARDLGTGEILWRVPLVSGRSATAKPLLTSRYVVYRVNSFDFGNNAWTYTALVLDKKTGKVLQRITPDGFGGDFVTTSLQGRYLCLYARGRVVVYGPR